MSKGSRPRPYSVTQDEYDKRWDMIFGRDQDENSPKEPQPSDTESQPQPQESTE
jgi:hypothetical protein